MPRARAQHRSHLWPLGGLLAALAATSPCAVAQEPELRFARLDAPELSHNSVYAIAEDAEGFLWIGTADGLNRYDGYEFRVFRHDPRDPHSLPGNVVYDIEAAPGGGLWVATGNGLGRFDPDGERFAPYPPRDRPGAAAQPVYDLFADRSGTLWASVEGGVARVDPERGELVPFPPPEAAAAPGARPRFAGVQQDPAGRLWFLGEEGGEWALWRLDGAQTLERIGPAADATAVFTFLLDRAGRVWLRTGGPERLEAEGDANGARAPRAAREAEAARSPPAAASIVAGSVAPGSAAGSVAPGSVPAWAFHESDDGVIWIGAENGLYRVAPETGRITHHLPDPERSAFVFNHVRALHEDRSGTLWVGTHGGLYRADPHAKPFRHLAGDPRDPRGLSSRSISAVYADSAWLWLGTYGAGLNRVDRSDATVRRYRHDPADPASLPDDIIWSLHRGSAGRLWIGTGNGLASLDPRIGRFRRHALPPPADARGARYVRDIAEDPAGTLWLTAGHGLYRFVPESGAARLYGVEAAGFEGGSVESVLAPEPGTVWIGMGSGDLVRLAVASEEFRHYPLVTEEGARLRSEGVWDVYPAADGALWLATGSGLSHFDPATGAFRHYLTRDGLPGSVVYSLLEDASGRLWLGTNAGLARFDPGAPPGRWFRSFDRSDGLGSAEFNRRAAFAAADGELFFGGLGGLTSFFPGEIRENAYVPPVAFTRVETADRETVTSHNPRGLERLVLSHREYALSFEVAALSYTNPARNRYAYRLEGFDEGWVDAGTRRFIRYTNLPPGDYALRVRGSNNDGLWNEEGAVLAVTVLPPFWATWWFRGAAVLALVAALVAAYRVRVGRLLEIERLRLQIAGDLHDDLSSNLSAIAILSDRARRHAGSESPASAELTRIGEAARGMVESVRDIVWLVDPAHDQLDDLVIKMKGLATSLLDGVELEFRSEPGQLSSRPKLGFRRQLLLIYKEILHNVARHARAERVSIEVAESDGRLRLRVEDDGVGFDTQARAAGPGFGLRSLRERASELGGTIEITSEPGAGTRVELEAPIR